MTSKKLDINIMVIIIANTHVNTLLSYLLITTSQKEADFNIILQAPT